LGKGKMQLIVRKATEDDLDSLKIIADAHSKELGFILRPALLESIKKGHVFVAAVGKDLAGFVEYHHRRDAQTTLYHIVIIPEYRGQKAGQQLVEALKEESIAQGKGCIVLKCPEELTANGFYKAQGFRLVTVDQGRRRRLNVWSLDCRQPVWNLDL
jgi:ribosomal protein S18 acetylase RimI-like enzyme